MPIKSYQIDIDKRNMHTIHIVLWFGAICVCPYLSGKPQWHMSNHMIDPVPLLQSCIMWVTKSHAPKRTDIMRLYIYNSSYHHHQTGSINLPHCCHFFRGCGPEVVVPSYAVGFIYISGLVYFNIVQSYDVQSYGANNQVHYGSMAAFICLHITVHHHHYAAVSEGSEILNFFSGTFCRVCV